MPIESLKKIWVSCHLLYPNPSQARDIFTLIVETGIDHSSTAYGQIFQGIQKLHRIYKQRDPVKSGATTFEFTSIPLNYWRRVLQKCNKDETFIVMLALLDLISFKDISRITKIPQTKVRYLFNQSVKKVISSPAARFDQIKEIKFKEYNTQETTALFINEHIIEYVLGISDSLVAEKVEAKLKDNNRYNDYRNEILKFKAELNDLTISSQFDEVMQAFDNSSQLQNLKKLEIKQQKRIFIGVISLVVVVVGLILRPTFLKAPISESTDKKVVLEEIAITKNTNLADDNNETSLPAIEPVVSATLTATTSAATVAVSKVASSTLQKADSTDLALKVDDKKNANKTIADKKLIDKKSQEVVAAQPEKLEEKTEPAKLVKPTGVYRGTITVTDFDQVTAIIRDRIISIGGKKAGEVELGWIKNKNISYFHFVFPAEKREELVNFIQQYGRLQYKFEPHPRALPIGQSRFIIEVYKGE